MSNIGRRSVIDCIRAASVDDGKGVNTPVGGHNAGSRMQICTDSRFFRIGMPTARCYITLDRILLYGKTKKRTDDRWEAGLCGGLYRVGYMLQRWRWGRWSLVFFRTIKPNQGWLHVLP